ncbi:MAG TPA: hypothetical protein VGG34_05360 [Opitutaceae bacterium]|jgi:hypothetical protein
MTRELEDQLLEFALRQKESFGADAWIDFQAPAEAKAVLAAYLADTTWFGHRAELQRIAERVSPGSLSSYIGTSARLGFEPGRFRGRFNGRTACQQSVS